MVVTSGVKEIEIGGIGDMAQLTEEVAVYRFLYNEKDSRHLVICKPSLQTSSHVVRLE